MGKDYLKDEANVLRVQQHQLKNANNKISEIEIDEDEIPF